MSLQVELEWFDKRRNFWLKTHKGKYALVSGRRAAGFFIHWPNAFKAGLRKFGVKPFLIKRVLEGDEVFLIFWGSLKE
jgi:hypothetical protein